MNFFYFEARLLAAAKNQGESTEAEKGGGGWFWHGGDQPIDFRLVENAVEERDVIHGPSKTTTGVAGTKNEWGAALYAAAAGRGEGLLHSVDPRGDRAVVKAESDMMPRVTGNRERRA